MATNLIANFSETVQVTRRGAGSYNNGKFVDGATSQFDVVMSVQPLTSDELLQLPEGQRTRRSVKGYTTTRLFAAKQTESKKADLVDYDGKVFEVQNVQKWQYDLEYYKVTLTQENPQ